MMVTARSISSSATVSGGAMRRQLAWPPVPPRTRSMESPQRWHSSVRAKPRASAGSRVPRSSTSLEPAHPTPVVDRPVPPPQHVYVEAEVVTSALEPRRGELSDAGWFQADALPGDCSDSVDVAADAGWLERSVRWS